MTTKPLINPNLPAIVTELMQLQDRMNLLINPTWRDARYDWHRAIWMEAGEAMEALPWKWWKAQDNPSLHQLRLEAIDILHFLISWAMQDLEREGQPAGASFLELEGCLNEVDRMGAELRTLGWGFEPRRAMSVLERIAHTAAGKNLQATAMAFSELAAAFGLDSATMRTLYVAKNALNIVRNRLGYKKGTYVKIWAGEEDNVHLERLMAEHPELDLTGLCDALVSRYQGLGLDKQQA